MARNDGRAAAELRKTRITTDYVKHPLGSVLIEVGDTRVLCNASVEESVPRFLRDSGKGWVTAEYGMLPGSSSPRIQREASRGKVGGRTMEIQRLIGRSLRAVIDMKKLGERTIWVDCDVIQADGGTRTASITGAYIALALAIRRLIEAGKLKESPLVDSVAAVSVGIVGGEPMLDLPYEEDSRADVDMNLVMTGKGRFVEIQGTAEADPFDSEGLDTMLELGRIGIAELTKMQAEAIEGNGAA